MMNKNNENLAEIAGVTIMEIQNQLAEVANNIKKICRQNHDLFSRLNCGASIIMTSMGDVNILSAWGNAPAIDTMRKAFDESMNRLSNKEE